MMGLAGKALNVRELVPGLETGGENGLVPVVNTFDIRKRKNVKPALFDSFAKMSFVRFKRCSLRPFIIQ
jgi:hypothetical protein